MLPIAAHKVSWLHPPEAIDSEPGRTFSNRVRKPLIRAQDLPDVLSAHIHINLLPQAQQPGWDVKLIDKAVEYLKPQSQSALFMGIGSHLISCYAAHEHRWIAIQTHKTMTRERVTPRSAAMPLLAPIKNIFSFNLTGKGSQT